MISRITAPFDEEITPMVSTFVGKGFLCFASNKPFSESVDKLLILKGCNFSGHGLGV
jgi:hypothetical protein